MKKEKFVDDGRVICRMDVEGMPRRGAFTKASRLRPSFEEDASGGISNSRGQSDPLTKRQTIRYVIYSYLAMLSVLAVIGGGCVLVILIMWLCLK